MDYEKKYYKALEDMRAIYPNLNIDARLAVEHAFPEFAKEREDGWYIEELQGFLDSFGEDYFGKGEWQRFADWLEKQKEQKPNKQTEIEIEEAAEKAALEFAYQYPLENGEYGVAKFSFMRGAEWQRQQGIVWSEKDEEKKAYDKGFKAAEEFYCGRII